jgi:DNA-binding transcriptional LysR family regulator
VIDDHLQGLLPRLARWELDLALVCDHPRIAFGSDDYNAVQAFVAVGLGVAMLPRLALAVMRPGLGRVALAEPPVRRVAAARLAASHRSAATASMLAVLQETAADAFTASPRRAPGRRR